MTTRPGPARIALAYAQVLLAGSLWATSGPFSVALFRMGVPPTSVAILRPAAGLLFLFLFVAGAWIVEGRGGRRKARNDRSGPELLGDGARSVLRPDPRALVGMLLVGGAIVGVFQLAYQLSTEAVGVPATVALLYLAPAIVVGASVFLFREPLTLAKGSLAAVSLVGVWLTVFGTRGVDVELTPAGILWGCMCGLGYASYTLFGKWYGKTHGPLAPLFWSTLAGTALLGLAWWIRGVPVVLPASPLGWLTLLLFGLLTIALAALLLFNAMRTLEAGRASIGTTVEPLVAALLAWLLLDQTLTPWGRVGLVLLVVGVAGAYGLRSPGGRGGG
jgi:drug/metabolite transporter (DMT)-like permease